LAHLAKEDLKDIYTESKKEADIWKEDYPAYERLANNDLLDMLDPNLPEVNDGSLAAALFKLPKRIVNRKLSGFAKATDRDEAWMSELANLQWKNEIIPNAKSQATFHRKWKDSIRKSAIYGGVPLITLFIDKDDVRTSDFIVAAPQDVVLEAGKVSDLDSDVIFWDVYYTKLQVEEMIEQAKAENKARNVKADNEGNVWYPDELEAIKNSKQTESRTSKDSPKPNNDTGVRPEGFHFCMAFQRGKKAPFYMYHPTTDKTVHEWLNDDPTGDIPVHYLYCYQDFVNPYGIGIVKLAGGTQNVLDYFRQADVLATQLGIRPPKKIKGDPDEVDFESLVYEQDADWFVGDADVDRMELADGVYQALPGRMEMYQGSLNKLIPMGDSTVSAGAGDPLQSKTPAGVKQAQASLSIDDEDYKDNLYETYAAVAKSMINIKFANMEGTDLMKLSDDERKILINAGLDFPENEAGEMSNQLELVWDKARAEFEFEVDPEADKATDDSQKLEGLTTVTEFIKDPATQALIAQGPIKIGNKQLDPGELIGEIIALTTDNDKIITDVSAEEEQADDAAVDEQGNPIPGAGNTPPDPKAALAEQQLKHNEEKHQFEMDTKHADLEAKAQAHDQKMAPKPQEPTAGALPEQAQVDPGAGVDPATLPNSKEMQANIDAVRQSFGVDEETAIMALAAEHEGYPIDEIIATIEARKEPAEAGAPV
jgi:hypothetical protein